MGRAQRNIEKRGRGRGQEERGEGYVRIYKSRKVIKEVYEVPK